MVFYFTHLPHEFVLRLWAKGRRYLASEYSGLFCLQSHWIYFLLVMILRRNDSGINLSPVKENLICQCFPQYHKHEWTCLSSFLKFKIQNSHYYFDRKYRTKSQLDHKMHSKENCCPCLLIIILLIDHLM